MPSDSSTTNFRGPYIAAASPGHSLCYGKPAIFITNPMDVAIDLMHYGYRSYAFVDGTHYTNVLELQGVVKSADTIMICDGLTSRFIRGDDAASFKVEGYIHLTDISAQEPTAWDADIYGGHELHSTGMGMKDNSSWTSTGAYNYMIRSPTVAYTTLLDGEPRIVAGTAEISRCRFSDCACESAASSSGFVINGVGLCRCKKGQVSQVDWDHLTTAAMTEAEKQNTVIEAIAKVQERFIKPSVDASDEERADDSKFLAQERRKAVKELQKVSASKTIAKAVKFTDPISVDDTSDPVGYPKEVITKARELAAKAGGSFNLAYKVIPSNGADPAAKEECSAQQQDGEMTVMGIGIEPGDWGILCNPDAIFLVKLQQEGNEYYSAYCWDEGAEGKREWALKGNGLRFGDSYTCDDGSIYYIGSIVQVSSGIACESTEYEEEACGTLLQSYENANCHLTCSANKTDLCGGWRHQYKCRNCCDQ
jgi:hypothetical protein